MADLTHVQKFSLPRDVDRVHICQFLLSVHRHLEHILRRFQLEKMHIKYDFLDYIDIIYNIDHNDAISVILSFSSSVSVQH